MATYKKRSRKNTSSSDPNSSSTKQVFETLDDGASRTEVFVNRYQKYLTGFVSLLLIMFVLYFAYEKFILQPKINEADQEIFTAQKYFNEALNNDEQSDSLFNLSLNGAEGKFGFLDIIENFVHLANEKEFYFNEKTQKIDSKKTEKLIFPRYHQLDLIKKFRSQVRKDGVGKNYLVQHTTGSGKSYSIGWLTHTLTSLYQKDGDTKRMFDVIIVVTDRKVLDNQFG